MIRKILNWFRKEENLENSFVPENENQLFILMLEEVVVGYLYCRDGLWHFEYDNKFKELEAEYNLITGFPNINKTYISESLWPFFQVRIPGLGQPRIKEILEDEGIDMKNELELLKRFGNKVISNPYTLTTR